MNNKTLARFFYEQCAGSTTGHMAMVPNNPVIFGLIKACSNHSDNSYAATEMDFAEILRGMADSLDESEQEKKQFF